MRLMNFARLPMTLLASVMLISPTVSLAAPATGGTGPGGVGTTNGGSNLRMWLNADTISQGNSTPVASWTDGSGSGNSATTAGSDPTYLTGVLNGRPTVSFASGNLLSIPAVNLTNMSVFAVAQSANDNLVLWNTANRQARLRQGGAANISGYNGGDNPISTAITAAAGDFFISEWLSQGSSNTMNFFENGAARGSGTFTGGNPTGFNQVVGITVSGVTIQISEVAQFNALVSSTERSLVENALTAKYGLSMLGADHYNGDTGPKGDYDFNVFGIGNDGTSSVSSSGQAGFGIEAAGPLSSNTWALAGHANGPNGVTTVDMPNGLSRWERSWYIDNTGVGSANLAFDWDEAGNTAAFDASLLGLYFRSTNSGLFSLIAVGTVDIGNQRVDFLNVTLDPNDGYYTLGALPAPEPSTFALLGLGAIGLAIRTRRRRSAA